MRVYPGVSDGIPGGSAATVPIAQHVYQAGADASLALRRGCVRCKVIDA